MPPRNRRNGPVPPVHRVHTRIREVGNDPDRIQFESQITGGLEGLTNQIQVQTMELHERATVEALIRRGWEPPHRLQREHYVRELMFRPEFRHAHGTHRGRYRTQHEGAPPHIGFGDEASRRRHDDQLDAMEENLRVPSELFRESPEEEAPVRRRHPAIGAAQHDVIYERGDVTLAAYNALSPVEGATFLGNPITPTRAPNGWQMGDPASDRPDTARNEQPEINE